MRAVLPLHLLHVDQPQIRLVDERRRLQGMAAPLTLHVARGNAAQLRVDERQQRVERVGLAPVPGQEQRRRVRTCFENSSILYPFGGPRPFLTAVPAYSIRVTRGSARKAAGRPQSRSERLATLDTRSTHMFDDFLARAVTTSLVALVGMSLGYGRNSPSPTQPAPPPRVVVPSGPDFFVAGAPFRMQFPPFQTEGKQE